MVTIVRTVDIGALITTVDSVVASRSSNLVTLKTSTFTVIVSLLVAANCLVSNAVLVLTNFL